MIELKWEEPPADGRRRSGEPGWRTVVEALKASPGAWALVGEDTSVGTSNYLKRRYPGIEVTVRGTKNGRAAKIYARWVGDT